MELREVIRLINGKLLYGSDEILDREYSYAVASDMMSNVMLDTADDSILITSLVNPQVIRASEMMNITCIIITCGMTVTETMVELAANRNIALVETKDTTFTVCGKLHGCGLTEGPVSFQGTEHLTSIKLIEDRCIGCIHCVRACPTEALRIRNWKAVVTPDRCVECGKCIQVCPRHAIRPVVDTLEASLDKYDYKVAIPASAFYGQFRNVKSRNHLLTALKRIGFDDIYEEAIGAEMISYSIKKRLAEKPEKLPIISSSCPSILNLIQIKFPNLIEQVVDFRPPVEVAARIARREAEEKHPDKKIGIFFIAPCTAKISYIRESDEVVESDVDEMVAISEVYKSVLANLKALDDSEVEELEKTGVMGIRWTTPGGEGLALDTDKFIAVEGIAEVVDILEKLEDEKLDDLEFIEADACIGGCNGGSLTVENRYSARSNIKVIVDEAKEKYGNRILNIPENEDELLRNRPLVYRPVLQLDEDLKVALKKMEEMGRIVSKLPGVDCGVCGSPTCKSFAEDVVRGQITEKACIIRDHARKRRR